MCIERDMPVTMLWLYVSSALTHAKTILRLRIRTVESSAMLTLGWNGERTGSRRMNVMTWIWKKLPTLLVLVLQVQTPPRLRLGGAFYACCAFAFGSLYWLVHWHCLVFDAVVSHTYLYFTFTTHGATFLESSWREPNTSASTNFFFGWVRVEVLVYRAARLHVNWKSSFSKPWRPQPGTP